MIKRPNSMASALIGYLLMSEGNRDVEFLKSLNSAAIHG